MSAPLDLETILDDAGVGPMRVAPTEIHAPCPMHVARTGQPDHHPSWSINRQNYVHLCFSCGYKGTLNGLLHDLTGAAPEDLELRLNEQSFLRKMATVRTEAEEHVAPVIDDLTEWRLRNIMRDVPQRLLDFRHLLRTAVDFYEVRWNGDTKQWVMPLRSIEGYLIGAQYRQKGSVLTLPEGMAKSHTLFGFNQCCEHDFCVLVESPLDAVRLYGATGQPALSSLGAWVSQDQVLLLARNFTTVYLALDNDKAGRKACEIVGPMLKRAGTTSVRWIYDGLRDEDGEPAKDPGDVCDDESLLASWKATVRMGM